MNVGRSGRWLVGLAGLLLVLPGDGSARREDTASETLAAVNSQARAAYAQARKRALDALGPVVLWNGEELIFRHGTTREVSRPIPALYDDLKVVGHLVLGLHALVTSYADSTLNEPRRVELRQYRQAVEKARQAIRRRGLTPAQEQRQEELLAGCDAYLGSALRDGKADVKELLATLRKLQPLLDENTSEAARAQIDGMHRQMETLRRKLSAEDWKRLRVIVQGSQQPRKGSLAVQYFARLLGEAGEGRRILYAEALFDETKALTLLGSKLVDRRVAEDLWGDPERLNRDLLGDAAKTHLDELFRK